MEFVAAEVTTTATTTAATTAATAPQQAKVEPKAEVKVEVKTEPEVKKPVATPKPTRPTPKPTSSTSGSTLSTGFSLKSALSKGNKTGDEEGSQSLGTARVVDPATEQKLTEARDAILNFISSTRPRFTPLFEAMKITEGAIELIVPTTDVEQELRRTELEMMAKIVEIAEIRGYVELRIEVNEEVTKSSRPIKLEDRVAHFASLNPLIAELTKALDLQVDN